LKKDAVFVPDGNQERVVGITRAVASAIVLNLDDDTLEPADSFVPE
jgi:hypothetical protein